MEPMIVPSDQSKVHADYSSQIDNQEDKSRRGPLGIKPILGFRVEYKSQDVCDLTPYRAALKLFQRASWDFPTLGVLSKGYPKKKGKLASSFLWIQPI